MKFKISVTDFFSAAHNLRQYQGKCEKLHGHNFKVKVTVGAKRLDKAGMVADFHYLKDALKLALRPLDHSYLNKLPFFQTANPTSENVAQFIFKEIRKSIKAGHKLLEVSVWENETNEAIYQE